MHIGLDGNVRPVHSQVCRVSVVKLDRVNEDLEKLSDKGIIKPVTQPTDWLSNIFEYALIQVRPSMGPYWNFRDKISVYDGVAYRCYQVIVRSSLREEMLQKIHKAHQRDRQQHNKSSRISVLADIFQLDGNNYLVIVIQ